jgi:hypothetical protein
MKSGIALYSLEDDGCLNGVFTNDELDGEINNEIAKLHTELGEDDDLCGIYHCFFFDRPELRNNCELTIDLVPGKEQTYSFTWESEGSVIFSGIGYRMNEKQVVVHYKYRTYSH